ncbi:MAG: HAD family hydrolase [Pseudonocardiaceae bacterium]
MTRRLPDTVLESAGLAPRFQVSVSTEDVGAGKPSPAAFQTVVQRLGGDSLQRSCVTHDRPVHAVVATIE